MCGYHQRQVTNFVTRPYRLFIVLPCLAALMGCASPLYYIQAIQGQAAIFAKSRPVEDWLADPATPAETKSSLELAQKLREFASRELLLPDNQSYRTYADLARPYALWNVFAAPELALKAKQWCFIVAGCVPYRGYFVKDKAEKFAATLKQEGYDVYIGGVRAYSTLGWFNDPLLNTFIHRGEAELAGLLFHELAHQKLYVMGDSTFNESFATAVEIEGVKRWFRRNGAIAAAESYIEKIRRRDEFAALVEKYRAHLSEIYQSNTSAAEKRAAKMKIFADLRHEYGSLKTKWNGYTAFDSWISQDLNNAHLAAIGLYNQYVTSFQILFRNHGEDFTAFFRAVEEIARLSEAERHAALAIPRAPGS
jgi:predicted aminopeptidase